MHVEASCAALRITVRPLSTLMSNLRAVQPEPEPGKPQPQQQQQQQKAGGAAADTLAQHLRGSWRRLGRPAVEEWMASVSPAAEGSAADASAASLPWWGCMHLVRSLLGYAALSKVLTAEAHGGKSASLALQRNGPAWCFASLAILGQEVLSSCKCCCVTVLYLD